MSFYIIISIIYILCYLYIRLWICRMLNERPLVRRWILITTDIMTVSLPLTIYFKNLLPHELKHVLQGTGYTWASIIVCMVPLGLCAEPIRMGFKLLAPQIKIPKEKIFGLLCLLSGIMVIAGYINASSPVIKEVRYDLTNGSGHGKEYDIAAVSDIHAGKLMTRAKVANLIDIINHTTPDIIILGGDTLDDRDCKESKALSEFSRLTAPLGIYAVLGNHEYYIGDSWAIQKLKAQGIEVLRDSYKIIDGKFILAGRDDFAGLKFNSTRKQLKNFIPDNIKLPVILIDHTPIKLNEAADYGVALQFSGHTHNGQLFPFNYLVDKLYEVARGELRKKNTIFYVSSGAGFWGPPLRTNSRPEIILFRITI